MGTKNSSPTTSGPGPAARTLNERYEAACALATTTGSVITYAGWRELAREIDQAADAAPTMGQRMALRDRADDCRQRADRLASQRRAV